MKVKITLPKKAELVLKPPQTVNFNQTILKISKEKIITINISQELGTTPEKIYNYLKKLIGEKVKKGEILAEKKGLILKKIIKSPHSGEIIEINHLKGTLSIKTDLTDKTFEFKEIKGKILEKQDDELVIDLKEPLKITLKKTNLAYLTGGEFQTIQKDAKITQEQIKDKIVFLEEKSYYLENKLTALKAKCLITLYPPKNKKTRFAQIMQIKDAKLLLNTQKK